MLDFKATTKFDRDVKRLKKRGRNLGKLRDVVDLLRREETLPAKNRAHKLTGNWIPCWECHIEPDWLLVWRVEGGLLLLVCTGSHSDLFK